MTVVRVVAGASLLLAISQLIGWYGGLQSLLHVLPGISMPVNTGVCIVLLATASMLSPGLWRTGLVSLALMIALVTGVELLSGINLGIDQLLFREPAGASGRWAPGRMAPLCVVCVLLLGAGMLAQRVKRPWPVEVAALATVFLSVVPVAALGFAQIMVPTDPSRQMSISGAVCMFLLAVSLLRSRPDTAVVSLWKDRSAAGRLFRLLLPSALVVPASVGLIRTWSVRTGLLDEHLGMAWSVTLMVFMLAGLMLMAGLMLRSAQKDTLDANQFLDTMVENLPDMLFVKDAETLSFQRFNKAGEQLLGVSRSQLIGKNDFDLFPHDEAAFFQSTDRKVIDGGQMLLVAEEPVKTSDGEERWLRTKKVPLQSADGRRYLLGISEDITDERRAQAELQRWGSIFAHAQWGIAVGRSGNPAIVTINPAFATMFGVPAEALVGQSALQLFAEDERAAAIDFMSRQGDAFTFQTRLQRTDGTVFDALMTKSTVKAGSGPASWVINLQDITAIKQAERELRRLKDAAEASAKELEAFSYSVSHDLRAPLRAIDGFSQALQDEGLSESGRVSLSRVRLNASRMGQLIDDLLELSRVTRKPFATTRVDVTAIADDIAAALQAREPGRTVRWSIARGLHADADEGLVKSALENLLGNAFKFTAKKASAHIEVGQTTDAGEVVFFVKDDGAGFDMAYVDRLFGAFQRLHGLKDFEGSGIGLATVARIIRRHGGRIWATSQVDHGATFSFTLTSPTQLPS